MSDDTDLFPFGCDILLETSISINNEVFYLPELMDHLMISYVDFKTICCLSSNDYNLTNKKKNFIYYYNI